MLRPLTPYSEQNLVILLCSIFEDAIFAEGLASSRDNKPTAFESPHGRRAAEFSELLT